MKIKIQGIYKIRNCINGKVYIGQSIDILFRFWGHKNNVKTTYKHPLYDSIRCYGIENFEFIIIEEVEDINSLDSREQYWLEYYKAYNREYGYNLAFQTCSPRHSEETRLKISQAVKNAWKTEKMRSNFSKAKKGKKGFRHTDEVIKKIVESRKWYKHSDATKLKISKAHIGKKLTEEHKRKISRPAWNKGKTLKKLSSVERKKISERMIKIWANRKKEQGIRINSNVSDAPIRSLSIAI